MPKLDLNELRGLSEADLQARANELREEQFRLKFRSATETLEDPLRLRSVRRDVARVLTVLREKQLGTVNQAPKAPAAKSASKTASKGTSKRAAAKGAAKRTTKTAR